MMDKLKKYFLSLKSNKNEHFVKTETFENITVVYRFILTLPFHFAAKESVNLQLYCLQN